MKNAVIGICFAVFMALCSADRVGVDLPVSALMMSVVLTIATLIFAPKVFPVEKNRIMPYVLAWFYGAFLTTAAIGAYGKSVELTRTLYVFSVLVFFIGVVSCYVLYKKNVMFSLKEFRNIAILYFLGLGVANIYGGFV